MKSIQVKIQNSLLQFKSMLKIIYRNEFKADNKTVEEAFQVATNRASDLFEQYSNLMIMAESSEIDAKFKFMQLEIKKNHAILFRNEIRASNKRQESRLKALQEKLSRIVDNFNTNQLDYHYEYSLYTKNYKEILFIANLISTTQNYKSITPLEFQKILATLRNNLERLKTLDSLPPPKIIKRQPVPNFETRLSAEKTIFLNLLDTKIKLYESRLNNENLWVRFIKWFSPARTARRNALNAYHATVNSPAELNTRYNNALKWLKTSLDTHEFSDTNNNTSRFLNNCLLPMQEESNKLKFITLPCFDIKEQTQLNRAANTINETLQSYNSTMHKNAAESTFISNKINHITRHLTFLKSLVDQPQNDDANVNIAQIGKTIVEIKKLIPNHSDLKITDEEESIIASINKINANTSAKVIAEIYTKKSKIKDEKALGNINHTLDGLVTETQKFGGTGRNALFMGFFQAEKVINALGTTEQQNKISALKKEKMSLAKQAQHEEENDFVDSIKRKVDSAEYPQVLSHWDTAYKSSHNFPDYKQNLQSDMTYKQIIKPERAKALKFHASENNILKKYIDEQMSLFLYASSFSQTASKFEILTTLNSACMNIFILVYASNSQIKLWNEKIFPEILENFNRIKMQRIR